jgi:hypothetical protein
MGSSLPDGPTARIGVGEDITYKMWLRIKKGKRGGSIFQLGAPESIDGCAIWNYMISLEIKYAPEDANGYLYYWVTDENVSVTEPVYAATSTNPFPPSSWVHVVIVHTRTEGVVLYVDGQNVPVVHDKPPVFPPNVHRGAVNFNSGREIRSSKKNCFSMVDDRNEFSMTDFFIWNR